MESVHHQYGVVSVTEGTALHTVEHIRLFIQAAVDFGGDGRVPAFQEFAGAIGGLEPFVQGHVAGFIAGVVQAHVVPAADILAQIQQGGVGFVIYGVGGLGVGSHLDGDCPVVILPAAGAPGTVFLLYVAGDAAVSTDAVIAACLPLRIGKERAQALHRSLPHHAVDGDAVDLGIAGRIAVGGKFYIGYQFAVAHGLPPLKLAPPEKAVLYLLLTAESFNTKHTVIANFQSEFCAVRRY